VAGAGVAVNLTALTFNEAALTCEKKVDVITVQQISVIVRARMALDFINRYLWLRKVFDIL